MNETDKNNLNSYSYKDFVLFLFCLLIRWYVGKVVFCTLYCFLLYPYECIHVYFYFVRQLLSKSTAIKYKQINKFW